MMQQWLHLKTLKAGGLLLLGLLMAVESRGAGYEFEGIGAREVSRAGAVIADVDDWTAVYWNPAGISHAVKDRRHQLGLEVFGGKATAKDSNSLTRTGVPPVFTRQHVTSPYVLGALGGVFPLGEKCGIGFGMYTPLLQGVDFDDLNSGAGTSIDLESAAGIFVANISLSRQMTERFSAAFGLNVLQGQFETNSTLISPLSPVGRIDGDLKGDGLGLEGIFGLRYDASEKWSFGAVYRTGDDVELKGDAHAASTLTGAESSRFSTELRHPPTAGIGAAYRPTEKWRFGLDLNQTYWSRFSNAIDYESPGTLLVDSPNTFHWKDSWKARVGLEHELTAKTDLMAGYSYNRTALDAGSVDLSAVVDVPSQVFALGMGHKWNQKWETFLGGIAANATRTEGAASYRLSGWQLMAEGRYSF